MKTGSEAIREICFEVRFGGNYGCFKERKGKKTEPRVFLTLSKSKGILGKDLKMRFLVGTLRQLSTSHHLPRNFPVDTNKKLILILTRQILSQVKNMTLCCSLY